MIISPSCSKNSGSSDRSAFFAALWSGDFYIQEHVLRKCLYYSSWLFSNHSPSFLPKIPCLWIDTIIRLYPQHDYHLRGPLSHYHWFLDDLHFYSLSLSDITSDFLPVDFKIHMDNISNTSASYFLRFLSFSNVTLHPLSVITLVVIF